MREVKLEHRKMQRWGVRGENRATVLMANAQEYIREWPNGAPQAVFRRADGYVYNVPCRLNELNYVLVELTNTETDAPGTAKIEIAWIEGDALVKSDTYVGEIADSMTDVGGKPPAPLVGYIEQVAQIGAEVAEAAERAENAAISQPIIGDNGNWFLYNPDTGEYEDSGKSSVAAGGSSGGEGEVVEF